MRAGWATTGPFPVSSLDVSRGEAGHPTSLGRMCVAQATRGSTRGMAGGGVAPRPHGPR